MEMRQNNVSPCVSSLLKVIGTDTDRSASYDFLLTFHSNHGPISYRFRDKGQFQSKTANISHPGVFSAPVEKVSIGIEYRRSATRIQNDGLLAEKEA